MKSTTPASLLFIFFLCIIFYAPLPSSCTSLYEALCNEYKPEADIPKCLNLMKTDPNIPLATNYHDLSHYILEMALFKVTSVHIYLEVMAKYFPTNEAIGQCLTEFNNSVGAVNNALIKLDNDPKSAREDAITAGFGGDNCNKALQNPPEKYVLDTIQDRNNEIFFVNVIASLSIIHLFD
ncbi:putative pectinesterase inhibitor domain-containing protein [Medicago truncatula]|uniref:Putative pectinesterase inhibitor domain-containing protein n=1 Tax=Medicago truncatula TaxID=3880 RepID=A0A072UA26_MEDTR|nr:transmembrane protein, putative [Medicago truncatula]RHN51093.1 putative pectinesterase inhibitor domain-containing protein [Medicago truncatula]